MSPPTHSQPTHIEVDVNLPALLGKLQVGLQRLSDLVAMGLAGAPKVEESDYNEPREFASVQIASAQSNVLEQGA